MSTLALGHYVRSQWLRLSIGFGALLASVVLQMQIPLLLREGVDRLTQRAPLTTVVHVAWAVLGLMLLQGFGRFLSRLLIVAASRHMEHQIRQDLWARLLVQPPAFFDRFYTGDLMARLTNDLNALRMAIGPAFMYAAMSAFSIVWAVTWMAVTHPRLTLAMLLPAVGILLIMVWGSQQIKIRFEKVQDTFGRLSTTAQEIIAGMREVKAYNMEDLQAERFDVVADQYVHDQTRLAQVQNLMRPVITGLMGTAFLVLLGYGGWLIARGQMSIGTFVAFQAYLGMLAWPLISVGWILSLWQRGRASWRRIQRLVQDFHNPSTITLEDLNQSMNDVVAPTFQGRLTLRGVAFGYRPDWPVLRGLDMQVEPGTWVAVVGPSASGKSTLLRVVAGLYPPTEGDVLWDDRPISAWPVETFRRSVLMVFQEPVLFSRTIRENLLLGWSETPPDEALWEVLHGVGLADEIRALPAGLDTQIGERGVTLSGGQRQRLALARAWLRRPRVLLLDDPFSQVDLETETRVWQALRQHLDGSTTVLLVTQRPRPILDSDIVYVLHQGQWQAYGSPSEVLRTSEWFRTWLRLQRRTDGPPPQERTR
ncbi:MAG: ABC transporter ATP-binding protein/permease [Acidobacteria bacterium]|nr:ABC transporter ATP-binding protein/permease [Acidobacteriota bacterium]MDW7983369.1 ABC transporter ATP-binding protein [Acidobacteriota bacterium]